MSPTQVTHLVLTRPKRFTYQPGDYIFLKIPAIAKYEWHPFTISSSPEQQGQIWVHVRSVGTWTNKLHTFIDERNQALKKDIELVEEQNEREPNIDQSTLLSEENYQTLILNDDSLETNSGEDSTSDDQSETMSSNEER